MMVARHPVSFGELLVLPIAAVHQQFTVKKNSEKFGMGYQDEYYVSKSLDREHTRFCHKTYFYRCGNPDHQTSPKPKMNNFTVFCGKSRSQLNT